jgi:phage gpG-like protein
MHGRSVSTVTAYTAHREWARRPPDERYASVHALAEAARARRIRTDARIPARPFNVNGDKTNFALLRAIDKARRKVGGGTPQATGGQKTLNG